MGEIDDYKRRENIKGMSKLIEYLLCEDKKDIFCVKIRKSIFCVKMKERKSIFCVKIKRTKLL
jgi:hypothetical protein